MIACVARTSAQPFNCVPEKSPYMRRTLASPIAAISLNNPAAIRGDVLSASIRTANFDSVSGAAAIFVPSCLLSRETMATKPEYLVSTRTRSSREVELKMGGEVGMGSRQTPWTLRANRAERFHLHLAKDLAEQHFPGAACHLLSGQRSAGRIIFELVGEIRVVIVDLHVGILRRICRRVTASTVLSSYSDLESGALSLTGRFDREFKLCLAHFALKFLL